MIAFLSLILLVAILAYFDARREKRMIDARPGGPDLDHKELIWRRLRNVGALVMVAVVCDGTEGWDALWMGLCHAAGAWGMFVLVHRLSLNLMRGMDWRYMAPGNWTDRQWLRIAFIGTTLSDLRSMFKAHARIYNRPDLNTEIIRPNRANLWVNSDWYREGVHRAGTLAYTFELTVLAASIVGAVAILN